MKILHLNLKAKWYDMIESGIKKEEYREIKPFWEKRLFEKFQHIDENGETVYTKIAKDYDVVKFIYGYTKRSMMFKLDNIVINTGNPDWGAEEGVKYFVIKLGERIEQDMLVAMDGNGRLYLWIVKPIRHKACWCLPEQYGTHISSYYVKIDSSLFPVVTWETDPRRIELNLL